MLGGKAGGVVQARVVIGWLAFATLIGLSVRRLISDGALTLEVWIYLLLMPAALASAMTPDSFWNRSGAEPVELVEEEEEDISIEEDEDGMVVTGVIVIDLLHQLLDIILIIILDMLLGMFHG